MKREYWAVLIVLGAGEAAFGTIMAARTLETVVQESDLIVVGTLDNVCKFSQWRTDYGRGIITVQEPLWGKVKPGEKLALEWKNRRVRYWNRAEYGDMQNKEAIWLVRLDGSGYVRSQRVVPVSKKGEVLEALGVMPSKEANEYNPEQSVEKLVLPPPWIVRITMEEAIIIFLCGLIGLWLYSVVGEVKRQFSLSRTVRAVQ
jgi:hypothetical protein